MVGDDKGDDEVGPDSAEMTEAAVFDNTDEEEQALNYQKAQLAFFLLWDIGVLKTLGFRKPY